MTDPNYTAVCLVIDRSGSMQTIRADAEGGINNFIESQRRSMNKVTLRIVQFDNEYQVLCPSMPVSDLRPYVLYPRGGTALLDAMGRGITEFGEELAALPEAQRPGQVVFAVMTDGEENSSREWTLDRVRALVEEQKNTWKWNIAYLGANQDAITVAQSFGIDRGSALTYTASSKGTRGMTESLDSYVATASAGSASFSEEDRKNASQS